MAFTALLCMLPNFHPETYFGLPYTWQLDMLIHSSYYCVLTLLLRAFFCRQSSALLFGSLIFAFSVVLELLQAFVPKRSASWLDIGSNALGIAVGVIFYWFINVLFHKNKTLLR